MNQLFKLDSGTTFWTWALACILQVSFAHQAMAAPSATQPSTRPTSRQAHTTTKPSPHPKDAYLKILKLAKQRNQGSFYQASFMVSAPSPQRPNIKIDWNQVPKAINQAIARKLQELSFRYSLSQKQPAGPDWIDIQHNKSWGRVLWIGALRWHIIFMKYNQSNRLLAFQQEGKVLYNAAGMYSQGNQPAKFYIDRVMAPKLAYKIARKLWRKRKPKHKVALEVPGAKNYTDKAVAWFKVPQGIPEEVAKVLQKVSLHQIKRSRKTIYFIRWSSLPKSTRGGTLFFLGRRWHLFVRHQFSRNHLLLHDPNTNDIYTAVGQYFRGQSPALLTIQGPFRD